MTDLIGDSSNNRLQGGVYDDNLYGYGGDDTLTGGAGINRLEGGDGNDFLVGTNQSGNKDVLIGGEGNDVFYLSGSYGGLNSNNVIEILDYSSNDTIELGFLGDTNIDELRTSYIGGVGSDPALTFIYDGNNQVLASISGTDFYELNPVGYR